MPWIRKLLNGKKVWARCDPTGKVISSGNKRVDVLYQPNGRVYQAALANILPSEETGMLSDDQVQPKTESLLTDFTSSRSLPLAQSQTLKQLGSIPNPLLLESALHIYTDGACTGNPGPMGIGVVILDPQNGKKEISEYLGLGTNNIAELTAILRGLEVSSRAKSIVIYSDSAYAIGLLSKNWKAKANQELVQSLRVLLKEFPKVSFVKVLGHSGVPENERCDELARAAILHKRKNEQIKRV